MKQGKRLVRLAALTPLLVLVACKRSTPSSPVPPRQTADLDSLARAYVRVVLALGERDPDSLDFTTAPSATLEDIHKSYRTYEAIDRETSSLLFQLSHMPGINEQQARAQSLTHQLEAVHARIQMLQGHTLGFTAEARILFQTEALPDRSANRRGALRARIAAMLPRGALTTTPSARYAAYDKHFLVPPDRLPAVMQAALGACRRQTLAHIALPPGESVDLAFVRNQPWSAFSRFHGDARSTISINTSFPVTIDQALELACHEGYPGHHVFNTLRDIAFAQQKRWPEAQVQPTFSPQSFLSESAAAFAPRLAFTLQERIGVERDLLFPLAGLPQREAQRYVTVSTLIRQLDTAEPSIAQQYLDSQLEFVRAAQQLQSEMLMEHPEATLLYLNEFRTYMLAYTDGPRRIATCIGVEGQQLPEDRAALWTSYVALMKSLSNQPFVCGP